MIKVLYSLCLGLLVLAGPAAAEQALIGHVRTVSGESYLTRDQVRQPAKLGDPVYRKDVVETGADGAIGITFVDNTVFSAGPDSFIALEQFAFDSAKFEGNLLAHMQRGTLSVVSGDIARTSPEAMKIRTPTTILGVRGTTFLVKVEQ